MDTDPNQITEVPEKKIDSKDMHVSKSQLKQEFMSK